MNNLLSIIIPVYGVERYIKEFLDSLLPQLNEKIECIFINDGTKDNSIKILEEEIKNYRINCMIINQVNGGVSKARNTGLDVATGDFITFLDPDDIVLEGYIQSILEIINQNNDIEIIHFNARVCCLKGDFGQINFVEETSICIINLDFKLKSFKKNNWQPWLRVFKRNILKSFRFPEGIIFEDLLSFPFIYKDNLKVYELNKQLIIYRLNESSLTSCKNEIFFTSMKKAIEFYRDYKDISYLQCIYVHLLENLYGIKLRSGYTEFSQFCSEFREDLIYINKNVVFNTFKNKFKWANPKLFYVYKTRIFMRKLK